MQDKSGEVLGKEVNLRLLLTAGTCTVALQFLVSRTWVGGTRIPISSENPGLRCVKTRQQWARGLDWGGKGLGAPPALEAHVNGVLFILGIQLFNICFSNRWETCLESS